MTTDTPSPVFSTEAVASMRETWISQGHDPTAFDEAAGLAEPKAAPTSADPATSTQVVSVEGITQDQLKAMADDLIAAGVAPERVKEALAADGIDADPAVEDARTDDERTFDRLFPKPSPGDYRPDYYGRMPDGTTPEIAAEYDTAARNWCASMDLAPEVGSHLIGEVLRIGQAIGRAVDADRADWKYEQAATFRRMAGSDEAAAQRTAAAAKLLSHAPRAFTDALKASGALDSAEVVTLLALEAERLAIRG